MKKAIPVALFGIFFSFILSIAMMAGGGESAAAPVGPVATEEKAEEYATMASKMGAPWEIVIITDALHAEAHGKSGIEDINPMDTTLQFLFLNVEAEHYELISSTYDEETGTWEEEYDWVYHHTDRYTAKEEILGFLGIGDHAIGNLSPESLITMSQEAADARSGSDTRYTASYAPNTGFETVLRDYIQLDEINIGYVLELYYSDYLDTWLTPEALERIAGIKAAYGMYQYVEDLGQYLNYEGLVFSDGSTSVTYFNQLDARWKNQPYGTDSIGGYACGPTAMSIVVSTLTSSDYDPIYMAAWAYQNGYWAKGNGSYHSLIPDAAEAFGLSVSGCTAAEPQRIIDALANGKLVVALMSKGHFTNSGHYIVLRGVSAEGKILVADPASLSRSQTAWSLSTILSEARTGAAAGGPFWIIS